MKKSTVLCENKADWSKNQLVVIVGLSHKDSEEIRLNNCPAVVTYLGSHHPMEEFEG